MINQTVYSKQKRGALSANTYVGYWYLFGLESFLNIFNTRINYGNFTSLGKVYRNNIKFKRNSVQNYQTAYTTDCRL